MRSQGAQFVRVGDGAAIVFCSQGAQYVHAGGSSASTGSSWAEGSRAWSPRVRGGAQCVRVADGAAAIAICSQGAQCLRVETAVLL